MTSRNSWRRSRRSESAGDAIPPSCQFLAAPFAASLILTGIHAYLGVHVVERGVIFVDLSLAQIAALGATIAVLMPFSGGDPHGPGVYWMSLGFTFIGAAVFSLVHSHRARVPQEAIIGICYAVASAGAIVDDESFDVTSRAPQGHAGRQHPRGVLARGLQDGARSTARSGCSTMFSGGASSASPSTARRGGGGDPCAALGLPFLRVLRSGRDVLGLDRRRAPRVLLPDRAIGRGDALRRPDRGAAGDRVDDGDRGVDSGDVLFGALRFADRRHDCLSLSGSSWC